jgi:hypothetical protein
LKKVYFTMTLFTNSKTLFLQLKSPRGPKPPQGKVFTINAIMKTLPWGGLDITQPARLLSTSNLLVSYIYAWYTQNLQEKDIHVPGGIRIRNPSKRSFAERRLRPLGHWDHKSNPIGSSQNLCVLATKRKRIEILYVGSVTPKKSEVNYHARSKWGFIS